MGTVKLKQLFLYILMVLAVQGAAAQSQQDESTADRQFMKTPQEVAPSAGSDFSLYLRANTLRWVTLTPDIGLELRFKRHYAVVVNGSWTTWSWNDKDRRYALRELAPELRYYIGDKCRGYVGAIYKVGAFNYKFSETGKQGNFVGGGITGGYVLPLNRCLSFDFSLGLGYLHAHYDRYNVIDGVRVRQGNGEKDWWGPISAGVTLTWKIF